MLSDDMFGGFEQVTLYCLLKTQYVDTDGIFGPIDLPVKNDFFAVF